MDYLYLNTYIEHLALCLSVVSTTSCFILSKVTSSYFVRYNSWIIHISISNFLTAESIVAEKHKV